MDIWIQDKVGFLTGYSPEPVENFIKVSVKNDGEEMMGGLLDFHNYYYDGKEITRNTNNPFQKFLDEEASKPPEPSKEEMAERIARLESLLSDLL